MGFPKILHMLSWSHVFSEMRNAESLGSGDFFLNEGQPSCPKLRPARLVLEHFKPKLHDLFRSFARRQLPGPTDAKVGSGTTRLKERTIWKQTQELLSSGYP